MKKRKQFPFIVMFIVIVIAIMGTMAKASDVYAETYTYKADSSVKGHVWEKTSDNTWEMDLDNDKTPDVTLTSSISQDGEEKWIYTFNVQDDTQKYYVYEQMLKKGDDNTYTPYDGTRLADGYTGEGDGGKLAVDVDPGLMSEQTHSYTITNSKAHVSKKYGELSIEKTVDGIQVNPDQEFSFTIQLNGGKSKDLTDKISGSQIFGRTPFMDGKAVISIKAGESCNITGIPVGLTYKVIEHSIDGYTLISKEGDSGTIASNEMREAKFTNRSLYVPSDPENQKYGSFTLVKKVVGIPEDSDAEYKFHVALSGLIGGQKYKYKIGEKTLTYIADAGGQADVEVSMKDGESVIFDNLEAGAAKYRIMEEPGNYIESYTVRDKENSGQIARGTDEAPKANTSLSTAEETADANESITITFTNTFQSVQKLTVRKYLSETINKKPASSNHDSNEYKKLSSKEKAKIDSDAQEEYEFTVKFYDIPDGTEIDSDLGKVRPDEYGEATKTFKLKADGTEVVFRNIPAGTRYRVTETKNDKIPSFQITTLNSREKPIDDENSVLTKELKGSVDSDLCTGQHNSGNDEDETLEQDHSDLVTFTNQTPDPIVLSILPITGMRGISIGIVAGSVCVALGFVFLLKRDWLKTFGRKKENCHEA